jgi:hypothetical protein
LRKNTYGVKMIGEGKKIKILSIFGTRPEAIKMAPVIRELESRPDVESRVVVTAQHREMLDQVVDTFNIKPDYDLEVMRPGQGLFDVTGVVLKGLKGVLEVECPDLVLVQGDTTTTFTGALAAFYCQIPVGHIEAGLRTYQKYAPFPEDVWWRSIEEKKGIPEVMACSGADDKHRHHSRCLSFHRLLYGSLFRPVVVSQNRLHNDNGFFSFWSWSRI